MEVWRPEVIEGRRPEVLSGRNVCLAAAIHAAAFAGLYLFACMHGLFSKDDEIVPIDLTVVVNENLEGKDDEPPPLRNPEPPKPKPKPRPKPKAKEPEKPKELEKIVTNVVTKVEKKDEAKKEEPKKPEQPKKSAKELREERIKRMRDSAKLVNKPVKIEVKNAPSGNGRTDRKTLTDAQIRDLLNKGYRPGKSEQLAASDEQLGYSLIKMALEAKWDKPPWTDTLKPMTIRVWFGPGGKVLNYKLEQSSGDVQADQTIKSAAARVGSVPGLPKAFIDKFRSTGVPCRFTVTPK